MSLCFRAAYLLKACWKNLNLIMKVKDFTYVLHCLLILFHVLFASLFLNILQFSYLFLNIGLLYVVFLFGFMSIGIIHDIIELYVVLKMTFIFKVLAKHLILLMSSVFSC